MPKMWNPCPSTLIVLVGDFVGGGVLSGIGSGLGYGSTMSKDVVVG